MTTEHFRMESKINIVHVPYKGSGRRSPIFSAGRSKCSSATCFRQFPSQFGKLRALAVTSAKRSPRAEGADSGRVRLSEFRIGYVVRHDGPDRGVEGDYCKAACRNREALNRADTREQLASQGATATGSRPDEFTAYLKSETAKWAKVLKASGVKLQP